MSSGAAHVCSLVYIYIMPCHAAPCSAVLSPKSRQEYAKTKKVVHPTHQTWQSSIHNLAQLIKASVQCTIPAVEHDLMSCQCRNLESLVQAEESEGISSKRVLIAGFSQGGAVSMLMLRSRLKVAAVLGMSTWLALADETPVLSAENTDTPVLMCHGNSDQVVSKLKYVSSC